MITLADRASGWLDRRTSRRGFLARTAVVGTAVVAAPAAYLLRPSSAYGAVCGPASSCSDGYTVFCCSINNGVNKCPPGTFAGGWWKADGSSYCCSGGRPAARYYIDCQVECSTCGDGCGSGHFCSSGCTESRCRCGGGSCDQRRVGCNVFRYGQCHQEIACSGAVSCRVITCRPPYEVYGSCTADSATDNATANHTAPCLTGPCA